MLEGGFMKKLGVFLLMVLCLFVTGCGEEKLKEVKTMDDFTTILTNNDFSVSDNSSNYPSVSYIKNSKKAVLDDIEIEMIEYSDSKSAETVLEGHIESFNLLKSTAAHEKDSKGDNYHRYFLVSNRVYMISARVENTLMFCKTNLDNKDTVDKIFEELGY